MNYFTLLTAVAPVFLIILSGYAIRRAGWLSAEADASLLRVVVNLLFPCLILKTILGNAALDNPRNLLLAPVVGFLSVAVGYALCYALAPFFGIAESRARRTFAFTAGIYNYGYIALPVVLKLFNEETAGVLFILNVGVEAAMWTLGIMLLTGASARHGWRHIISVPVQAIILALAFNFLGARRWLPDFALSAVQSLGAAAIPLGLVLTGAAIADQMRVKGGPASGWVGTAGCVLRLGLLPALMLAAAWGLPLPLEVRRVLLVQAAMPSAVIPIILARHYGADASVALRVVLATSALGLLTIPLWLRVGLHLLGH